MWKTCMSIGAVGAVAGMACAGWTPGASAATGDVTVTLNAPIVGMATAPTGHGYWEVASDGGIFSFGTAKFHGSMGGHALNKPIGGIARAAAGRGNWEVASDGGVFAFGSAGYYGSMGGHALNKPIVGIAAASTGRGYWEVASDGGVFAFGSAGYYGSMGGHALNKPIVGIAAASTGRGYWEVASDGGVFSFGSAGFYGSMGGHALNKPIVGIAPAPTGHGYWEVASDGGIFSFGVPYEGSMGGRSTGAPVVAMGADRVAPGYWEVAAGGEMFAMGDAAYEGAIISPTPSSAQTHLAQIVSVANGQVGQTDAYLYGPSAAGWCGYFTSWVWEHAGVSIPSTATASGIGTWALAHGGSILPPSTTPKPGDAVLWVAPYTTHAWPDTGALNYPNIEHVNIVTEVLSNGQIVTVGGNESGAVRRIGPYAPASASSYFGQAIYGFVQPPG